MADNPTELTALAEESHPLTEDQMRQTIAQLQAQLDAAPSEEVQIVREEEAAMVALHELYQWFGSDDRFTRKLDAIKVHLERIKSLLKPATQVSTTVENQTGEGEQPLDTDGLLEGDLSALPGETATTAAATAPRPGGRKKTK